LEKVLKEIRWFIDGLEAFVPLSMVRLLGDRSF
jgi:hypothetical protein